VCAKSQVGQTDCVNQSDWCVCCFHLYSFSCVPSHVICITYSCMTLSHLFAPHGLRDIGGVPWLFFEYVQMACLGHFDTLVIMHIFRGSSSYISEFKTLLNIFYEALIELSSITKKREIESAYKPPCGFWCLNDKMVKEVR
jgi:hypothetical protein